MWVYLVFSYLLVLPVACTYILQYDGTTSPPSPTNMRNSGSSSEESIVHPVVSVRQLLHLSYIGLQIQTNTKCLASRDMPCVSCEDISMCRNTKPSVSLSVHLSGPGSCPFFKQVLAGRLVLSPEVTVSLETHTASHCITPPSLPPVCHHPSIPI